MLCMCDIYRWRLGAWRGYYAVIGPEAWDGSNPVRLVAPLGVPEPRTFHLSLDAIEGDTRVARIPPEALEGFLTLSTLDDVEAALCAT